MIIAKVEEWTVSSEQRMKKFTLAASYESFIRLIEDSNELDKLEQIWNYIVTEIMQATAIKNLMKEGVLSKGTCTRFFHWSVNGKSVRL